MNYKNRYFFVGIMSRSPDSLRAFIVSIRTDALCVSTEVSYQKCQLKELTRYVSAQRRRIRSVPAELTCYVSAQKRRIRNVSQQNMCQHRGVVSEVSASRTDALCVSTEASYQKCQKAELTRAMCQHRDVISEVSASRTDVLCVSTEASYQKCQPAELTRYVSAQRRHIRSVTQQKLGTDRFNKNDA